MSIQANDTIRVLMGPSRPQEFYTALRRVLDDPNDSKVYLVMELVEQGELIGDVLRCEPFPMDLSRKYFRDVTCGLDEFIIVASDGLWDCLSNQQAVNFVRRRLIIHKCAQRVAGELVQEAIDQGSRDNTSAIICMLHQHDLK